MHEYIPENNPVILLLLIILTLGLYYFWWLARTSRIFGDSPAVNVLLSVLTAGIWILYTDLQYIYRSEKLNGRDSKWYMFIFLPVAPLIIQNNINEKYFMQASRRFE